MKLLRSRLNEIKRIKNFLKKGVNFSKKMLKPSHEVLNTSKILAK